MLDHIRAVTSGALDVLELLAVICALVLFAFAAVSLVVATWRVAIRGRVLVLPFGGTDERRVELTELFVRRLTELERVWIALAAKIEHSRNDINDSAGRATVSDSPQTAPLTRDGELPPIERSLPEVRAIAAPRTSGDELNDDIVELGRAGSLANADLGVISLAGVSFSPRDVLALLRAAPGVFARRTLRGSALRMADGSLVSVEFEERRGLTSRRRTQVVHVKDDTLLDALEDLAYRLAKERIYLVRDRNRPSETRDSNDDAFAGRSKSVGRAIIEAETWPACRAFLRGYAAHLEHYRHGRASDREDALGCYEEALRIQPTFARAAYNRAALLYNRYSPLANDEAIQGFAIATASQDPSVKPLAHAGLAMAHAQAVQRFDRKRKKHVDAARVAAARALELAPDLEEAVFARAWIHQLDAEWDEAIRQYEATVALPGGTAAERRIKSFALNNAAFILLDELRDEKDALSRAEAYLWRALELYPNKIAYANLGEIARRCDRRAEAVRLYDAAISLDPDYMNALNDRAIVKAELASAAAAEGRKRDAQQFLRDADADAARAQELAAGDAGYATKLADAFAHARDGAAIGGERERALDATR